MTTEHAYSTDNPEALAAFRDTAAAMRDYLPRLRADIAALGATNPLVYSGFGGSPDELVALEPNDTGHIPDGWRIVRGRLVPRRGKPGEPARQWLAAHQPPDVRHALTFHGLPRCTSIASGSGFRMGEPTLFEHDGVLWACYPGKPGEGIFDDQPCTWTPRRLSEFHAAFEAADAIKAVAQ